jgi:hypothetical protein
LQILRQVPLAKTLQGLAKPLLEAFMIRRASTLTAIIAALSILCTTQLSYADTANLDKIISSQLNSCDIEQDLKREYLDLTVNYLRMMLKDVMKTFTAQDQKTIQDVISRADKMSDERGFIHGGSQALTDLFIRALKSTGYITNLDYQSRAKDHDDYLEYRFVSYSNLLTEYRIYLRTDGSLGTELYLGHTSALLRFYRSAFITVDGVTLDENTKAHVFVSVRSPSVYPLTIDEYMKRELELCKDYQKQIVKETRELLGLDKK